MNTLLLWFYMVLQSTVLAWAPALAFGLIGLGVGLFYGWGWKALWLLPVGPVLVALVLAAWGMALPTQPTPAAAGVTRIAHANTLLYLNRPAEPKLAFAKNSGAEVVSLLEISPELVNILGTISGTYPHMANSGGRLPMVLLSTYPITRAQGWGERMVLYHIAKPNAAYYVLQVHPQSPFTPEAFTMRNERLALLAETLKGLPQPLIVLGDMNTTPWDSALAPLFTTVQQAGGWRARVPTFPSFMPLTPIDALYFTQPFTEIGLQHIKVPGSDHLGIVVDLVDARVK
ncbi:MAG: endonuclease/exonuclease/phosphatase family protein [Pseudomonadota bacterium]